jgi:hypothetical protein
MGPELNPASSAAEGLDADPQRIVSNVQITVDGGDVVITREVAGIWRGGPGLEAPTTQVLPEYRVSVYGQTGVLDPIFEIYDHAVADGDALAADRQVRLFYTEGDAFTLLKDYRPDHRL